MNNEEKLFNILQAPHFSEKVSNQIDQYAFKVAKNATKPEVKAAVEKIFNVKVASVRLCNLKGRLVRFKGTEGQQKSWKKAYITLVQGSRIELVGQS